MKIKKGDKVKIIAGKDRGREGVVEKVIPKEKRVVVTGVNLYKKHVKPRREGEKGGIIEIARPLDIAKVALICPKCKQGDVIVKKTKKRLFYGCSRYPDCDFASWTKPADEAKIEEALKPVS